MGDSANDADDRDVTSRYEKVEMKLLGEGTYGEVYKVRDNQTGEDMKYTISICCCFFLFG